MNVTTVGSDLAKNTFSVHGVDAQGKAMLRKTVNQAKLLRLMAQLPPCRVGLEACSGAHHWARQLQSQGHQVAIMAPRFVAPYCKGGKNDGNDAAAICEAVTRPDMRFTKRGDVYLRTRLIHSTRAVLATVKHKTDRLSRWAQSLIERRGYKRAAALAAKNASILWPLLVKGETFQPQPANA